MPQNAIADEVVRQVIDESIQAAVNQAALNVRHVAEQIIRGTVEDAMDLVDARYVPPSPSSSSDE